MSETERMIYRFIGRLLVIYLVGLFIVFCITFKSTFCSCKCVFDADMNEHVLKCDGIFPNEMEGILYDENPLNERDIVVAKVFYSFTISLLIGLIWPGYIFIPVVWFIIKLILYHIGKLLESALCN